MITFEREIMAKVSVDSNKHQKVKVSINIVIKTTMKVMAIKCCKIK